MVAAWYLSCKATACTGQDEAQLSQEKLCKKCAAHTLDVDKSDAAVNQLQ